MCAVCDVMVYGSETWTMKVDDMQKLERTESMMCGMSLKDRKSAVELRESLGIVDVLIVVSRHRLM